MAMEHPKSNMETYHLGTMEEITIEELIKTSGDIWGFDGVYENAPTYPGSVARRCPDITKAREQLGFEPKVGWKEGLETTLNWYREYLETGKEVYE